MIKSLKVTLSEFAETCTYQQDFLCTPYCYKTLSNHFHKSVFSIKVALINSIIKIYPFQKNVIFDA